MSTLPAPRASKLATASPATEPIRRMTIFDRGQEVVVPASAYTLSGFRAWATSEAYPERAHVSFFGKEILVDMSPEELETHAKVKGEITRTMLNLNKSRKLGEYYPDGALVTNVTAELSTVPDGVFFRWKSLESALVRLVPREGEQGEYLEIEGAPDWVLEIVSKNSIRKDTRILRESYYRAGVSEYWLIDARHENIDFQILVRQEAGYEPAPILRGGWLASPVFHRRFRLIRRRNPMGYWDYTLQVKPLR
jgi:Uma2 family endonuclease